MISRTIYSPPNLGALNPELGGRAGLCPDMLNGKRTLGSKSALCTAPQSIGRVVIGERPSNHVTTHWNSASVCSTLNQLTTISVNVGLYGNAVPATAAIFRDAVEAGVYTDTTFHRVLPGEYIQACTSPLSPFPLTSDNASERMCGDATKARLRQGAQLAPAAPVVSINDSYQGLGFSCAPAYASHGLRCFVHRPGKCTL